MDVSGEGPTPSAPAACSLLLCAAGLWLSAQPGAAERLPPRLSTAVSNRVGPRLSSRGCRPSAVPPGDSASPAAPCSPASSSAAGPCSALSPEPLPPARSSSLWASSSAKACAARTGRRQEDCSARCSTHYQSTAGRSAGASPPVLVVQRLSAGLCSQQGEACMLGCLSCSREQAASLPPSLPPTNPPAPLDPWSRPHAALAAPPWPCTPGTAPCA
jgi:hypothetical protein